MTRFSEIQHIPGVRTCANGAVAIGFVFETK
jgi:hypothetical protein